MTIPCLFLIIPHISTENCIDIPLCKQNFPPEKYVPRETNAPSRHYFPFIREIVFLVFPVIVTKLCDRSETQITSSQL